jgi:RecA-family ATPase
MTDERLEEALIKTKARLSVLDPIQAYLGSDVDMHRANEIRPIMKRLAKLAEKYSCAIVLIGHMNKASGANASHRGLGSIDFQAATRSVLIVGRIKDEPEIRVVVQGKSSLAPEGKPVAFKLERETGFEWIGEYDISVDDLLRGEGRGARSRDAKAFLKEVLKGGSRPQKEVMKLAQEQGIKDKTLRNAKDSLGIKSEKTGRNWHWLI